jgi:hypothetical protein
MFHAIVLLLGALREGHNMKNSLTLVALFLLLQTGCFARTQLETESRHVPADFKTQVLVVTVEDKVGLDKGILIELEQNALEALSKRDLKSVTLYEATGKTDPSTASELLRQKDYRALLIIVVENWGSKSETLQDPVPTTVGGPVDDQSSDFRPPTAFDYGETRPGSSSSYKEVAMVGSLVDLPNNQVIWSGRVNAKPAVVGRSFIYHDYNRKLNYEDLANDCLRKLAKELSRVLPD